MPKVLKLVLCVIVQALLSSCAKEEIQLSQHHQHRRSTKQKVWQERFEKGSMRYEGVLLELSAMIDEELEAAIKEQTSFEEASIRISERGN